MKPKKHIKWIIPIENSWTFIFLVMKSFVHMLCKRFCSVKLTFWKWQWCSFISIMCIDHSLSLTLTFSLTIWIIMICIIFFFFMVFTGALFTITRFTAWNILTGLGSILTILCWPLSTFITLIISIGIIISCSYTRRCNFSRFRLILSTTRTILPFWSCICCRILKDNKVVFFKITIGW